MSQAAVEKRTRQEVKLAGFGGQGIALMGSIVGKSAQLFAGRNAVFTQSYGPESRGGASSADVVIDENEIDYPYTEKGKLDYFVVMSKEAYLKFVNYTRKGGKIFYDPNLVPLDDQAMALTDKIYAIPATALAEQLGYRIVANIVMLGFFAKHTGEELIPVESLKQAILASVPARFKELNEKAFQVGYDYQPS